MMTGAYEMSDLKSDQITTQKQGVFLNPGWDEATSQNSLVQAFHSTHCNLDEERNFKSYS